MHFMYGFTCKGLDLSSTVLGTLPTGKKIAALPCSSSVAGLWYCLLYASYLNYFFICCGQEGQPFCCRHDWREVQSREDMYDLFIFPNFWQAEKQELQVCIQIKGIDTW